MSILSTLALTIIPLLKRPDLANKSLPETLNPRIIENAALKSRIDELETQIDDLNRKLDNVKRDNVSLREARDYWHLIARNRLAQNLEILAYQAAYQSARAQAQNTQIKLPQAAQQFSAWHDCTCVPGRAAVFGVLGENHEHHEQ